MVAWVEGVWGGMDWEFGVSRMQSIMCRMDKQQGPTVLAQYSVATWMGGECVGERIHIHI